MILCQYRIQYKPAILEVEKNGLKSPVLRPTAHHTALFSRRSPAVRETSKVKRCLYRHRGKKPQAPGSRSRPRIDYKNRVFRAAAPPSGFPPARQTAPTPDFCPTSGPGAFFFCVFLYKTTFFKGSDISPSFQLKNFNKKQKNHL